MTGMEEIPCTIQPLKLLKLAGDTKAGCGIIDVVFSTAGGIHVSVSAEKNVLCQ